MDQSTDTQSGMSMPQADTTYPPASQGQMTRPSQAGVQPQPGFQPGGFAPQSQFPPQAAPMSAPASAPIPTQIWLPPTVPVNPTAGNGNPTTGAATPGQAPAAPAGSTIPETAEDADLIEKEWVLHAKDIITRTRQDPFAQANELQKLKSEYLQKRYNKTIEKAD